MSSIDSINQAINEGIVNKPKKFNKMLAIGTMAILATGSSIMYYNNHKNSNNIEKTDKFESVSKIEEQSSILENNLKPDNVKIRKIVKAMFPIYESSNLINKENKIELEKLAQFILPKDAKDNQIGRMVSQIKFSDKDMHSALLTEAEGFTKHVKNDNSGYMVGFGTNVSYQKTSMNENLIKAVSQDSNSIKNFIALSGKFASASPNGYNFSIEPQRALQISHIHSEQFQKEVIIDIAKHMKNNSLAISKHKESGLSYPELAQSLFDNLKINEKAAISYHAYKVGGVGFSKYTGMLDELISYGYSNTKTEDLAKKVAEHITYKYKINGETKEDIRAETLVQSMFINPAAFGYLIEKNVAPKNMKEIPAINKHNMDTTVSAHNFKIKDPVGETKELLEKEGKPINMTLDYSDLKVNNTGLKLGQTSKGSRKMQYGSF